MIMIILKTIYSNNNSNFKCLFRLRASDRFIQPIFLRIFRCIGAFIIGNGCDICWSAVICMGDSWTHASSNSPNLTSFYSISYMAKFCSEESSKEKDSKISRSNQKTNTETGVRPLYLSPILHWFYLIRYMVSFWCGNTLLKVDFKNGETSQKIWGQQVVRPIFFYLEKVKQMDS